MDRGFVFYMLCCERKVICFLGKGLLGILNLQLSFFIVSVLSNHIRMTAATTDWPYHSLMTRRLLMTVYVLLQWSCALRMRETASSDLIRLLQGALHWGRYQQILRRPSGALFWRRKLVLNALLTLGHLHVIGQGSLLRVDLAAVSVLRGSRLLGTHTLSLLVGGWVGPWVAQVRLVSQVTLSAVVHLHCTGNSLDLRFTQWLLTCVVSGWGLGLSLGEGLWRLTCTAEGGSESSRVGCWAVHIIWIIEFKSMSIPLLFNSYSLACLWSLF